MPVPQTKYYTHRSYTSSHRSMWRDLQLCYKYKEFRPSRKTFNTLQRSYPSTDTLEARGWSCCPLHSMDIEYEVQWPWSSDDRCMYSVDPLTEPLKCRDMCGENKIWGSFFFVQFDMPYVQQKYQRIKKSEEVLFWDSARNSIAVMTLEIGLESSQRQASGRN